LLTTAWFEGRTLIDEELAEARTGGGGICCEGSRRGPVGLATRPWGDGGTELRSGMSLVVDPFGLPLEVMALLGPVDDIEVDKTTEKQSKVLCMSSSSRGARGRGRVPNKQRKGVNGPIFWPLMRPGMGRIVSCRVPVVGCRLTVVTCRLPCPLECWRKSSHFPPHQAKCQASTDSKARKAEKWIQPLGNLDQWKAQCG